MRKLLVTFTMATAIAGAAQSPYLEADSAAALQRRTLDDFSMTLDEGRAAIAERYGKLSNKDWQRAIDNNYIEVIDFGGDTGQRMFKKSVRNYGLINPAISHFTNRGANAGPARIAEAQSAIAGNTDWRTLTYTYTITVPPQPEFAAGGDIRVWMPAPMLTERQRNVRVLATTPSGYQLSDGESGMHRSLYFSQPASATDTLTFTATVSYEVRPAYYHPDSILANLKPYDTQSALYQEYTKFENPHIVPLQDLAKKIVGDETNPYRQSELVYDWIVSQYPWAGAREYSTIACIPQYVLDRGYGDCGQVALLYISLMRSLGVPAAWESGWYLLPDEVGIHDWAKVYFEGVGWVPVDASFGRYTGQDDPLVHTFHSHGIDPWRLAANRGVCGPFSPAKATVRSETVDQQMGEVEFIPADGSAPLNLFYPLWKRRMVVH